MSNESLRTTLTQALNKYALERGRILARIQDCRDAVFDAESNHKRSLAAEQRAVSADNEQVRKMRELMDYYNSRPEPRPQALLEQHTQMGAAQLETHRERMVMQEAQRNSYRIVEEKKRDLFVTEQDLKAIDARIQETTSEIQQLSQS